MSIYRRTPQYTTRMLLLCLLFCSSITYSQNSDSYLWESEVGLELNSSDRWSHSFGVGHRDLFASYLEGVKIGSYQTQHIELSHVTDYRTSEKVSIGVGLKYRFKETFLEDTADELRFLQEFSYAHPESRMGLGHRVRTEQRLKGEQTEYRFRYRIGGSTDFDQNNSLGLSTEALYSISPQAQPSLEQRITAAFTNQSIQNTALSFGVEYRLGDYTRNLENEFYLLTGIAFSL